MAHKDNRSYYRSMQMYYRQKRFKAIRLAAWLIIVFIALCALTPLVT